MAEPTGNEWIFDGAPFRDEDIRGAAGFVYCITNRITGKKYIGRKYFTSKRKPSRKATKRKTFDSNWKDYYGSSEELLVEIDHYGKEHFHREIISIHKTRGDVNIAEVKEQFSRNVLEDESYINRNINGKWHRPPKHIVEARRFKRDD